MGEGRSRSWSKQGCTPSVLIMCHLWLKANLAHWKQCWVYIWNQVMLSHTQLRSALYVAQCRHAVLPPVCVLCPEVNTHFLHLNTVYAIVSHNWLWFPVICTYGVHILKLALNVLQYIDLMKYNLQMGVTTKYLLCEMALLYSDPVLMLVLKDTSILSWNGLMSHTAEQNRECRVL